MAILESTAISNTKVKIRWKEPYVSEALDRALTTNSYGIYHGFNLVPGGGVDVEIATDNDLGDSLALVYDRSQDLSFAYRDTDAPVYDLTSYAGSRVYLFIYVNYAIGSETEAEFRVVDAAELSAGWVDAAISLGSVRVPSSGNVQEGDIEQATADFSGLTDGGGAGWSPMNDNPAFQNNFAGYEAFGDDIGLETVDSFVTKGAHSLRLGRASTGTGLNSKIELPLTGLEEGDKIFFKFKMAGNNISGATTLNVTLRTEDTIGGGITNFVDYDIVTFPGTTFEEFGYLAEVPALEDETKLIFQVGFPNNSDTGQFYIDELEVLQKPTGEAASAAYKTAEKFGIGTSRYATPTKYATIEEEDGGASFSGSDHTGAINMIDATYTELAKNSVAELSDHQDRTWQGLDSVIMRSVISGGDVVDDGSNTAVDVGSTTCRNTTLSRISDPDARAKTFDSVTGLAINTTEDNVVYADFSTGSIEITAYSLFTPSLDYVALAYINVSGGTIDSILDLRDYAQAIEEAVPITLQGSPSDTVNGFSTEPKRMLTLEGALKYAEVMYSNGREIVIDGEYNLGDVSAPITIPSGTTIRGATPKSRIIYNPIAGSENGLFYIGLDSDFNDVTIRDLRFEINTDVSTVNAPVIGNDLLAVINNFTVDNVVVTNNGAGNYPYRFIDMTVNDTSQQVNGVTVSNCTATTEDRCLAFIEGQAGFAFERVNIFGCKLESIGDLSLWVNLPGSTPLPEDSPNGLASVNVSDCFFASDQTTLNVRVEQSTKFSNCSFDGGSISAYGCMFSNCYFEIRGSAPTGLDLHKRSSVEGSYIYWNATGTRAVQLEDSSLSNSTVRYFSGTGVRMEASPDDESSQIVGCKIIAAGVNETTATIIGAQIAMNHAMIADTLFKGQSEDDAVVVSAGDYISLNGIVIVYEPGGGTGLGYDIGPATNTIVNVLYDS